MTTRRHAAHLLLASLALAAGGARAIAADAPGELPSVSDIKANMDNKQYPAALAQLKRLLDLKPDAAGDYDRHQLQMLRAECLLQTRDQATALKTLGTAVTEAKAQSEADEATALITLIHRSTSYKYTPKGAKPLDILNPDQRKDAYTSMWHEAETKVDALLKAKKKYPNVAAIMNDATDVVADHALEYVVTGKADKTESFSKILHDQAVAFLTDEIRNMADAVSTARLNANVVDTFQSGNGRVFQLRRGLNANDKRSLQNIENTGRQYPANMSKLSGLLPGNTREFSDIADQALAVAKQAYDVEHANYANP
jgi:hypothetical protein